MFDTQRAVSLLTVLLLASFAHAQEQPNAQAERRVLPGGQLQVLGKDGSVKASCPLKHTDVTADVAGFIGRVTVKQTFHNPLSEKVEAVYVFPLPNDGAVDQMVMTVGDRRIVGQVKKREEARQIYDQAVAAGHVASLLDQERPNVFTQSVANVEPGAEVTIEISYTQTLKYEDGTFEFTFPMVVGPRYVPGQPTGKQGDGIAPDTTEVPDASRISPPITPEGTRAGHDISLTLNVDAGMPLLSFESTSHRVDTVVTRAALVKQQNEHVKPPAEAIRVTLKNQESIPNKDFVFRCSTAGEQLQDAFLAHKDDRGHFFTLVLQPPKRVERKDAVGRELCFVLDTSGSMQGFPISKAKLVMAQMIDAMGPQDTFNLITFSGDTRILWDAPRPATKENIEAAQTFLSVQQGQGGTEMMKAIEAALVQPLVEKARDGGAPDPIRVVVFMTDGYVGNDMAIIDAVKKNAGTTRVFSFGIGSSVNHFLLDGMAAAGRGEVETVWLESQSDDAAKRFHERINAPVLTDVAIDWGTLPVADVYPKLIPDLWSSKPVVVHGRLTGDVPLGASITLKGNTAAGAFTRPIAVAPAPADSSHEAMASLWARAKSDDLMMRDMTALQNGNFPEELKKELTALGIEFRLMTQFTSFVAVEELTVTKGGKPTKVSVPVEMPEGVSYEGIFGERDGPMQVLTLAEGLSRRRFAADGRASGRAGGYAYSRGGRGFGGQSQGRQQIAQQAAPTALEAKSLKTETSPLSAIDAEATETAPAPATPADKLAEPLRDLAKLVDEKGKDGNLTMGAVIVTGYSVDVMVYLSDLSDATLKALKDLGFEQSAESKATKLVIGTIDVRKLLDLAKLDAVARISPVPGDEG